MRPATRGPWLPLQRIDGLVQYEPVLLMAAAVVVLWLAYFTLLRGTSAERHRILRGVLGNVSIHIAVLAGLTAGYFSLDVDAIERTQLGRLQPYVGLLVLIEGGVVLTKLLKVLIMQVLFVGHPREFVPALLINTFTGVVALVVTGWLAAAVFDLQLAPLLATSAVASVVLGLAIQDSLGNLFAGIAMQFDKPYEIGDWVEISGPAGKWLGQVYEVTWRATVLTGIGDELISIPNRVIGQGQVVNYSQRGVPFSRAQTLKIAHGSDAQLARSVVRSALAAVPAIARAPAAVVLLSEVGEVGVTLRIVYWIDDLAQQYVVADRVLETAMDALTAAGIELAVPRLAVLQPPTPQR